MVGHFHPVETTSPPQYPGLETRRFVGDGKPYLRLPGLTVLHECRIGQLVLPETERREYPLDPNGKRLLPVDEPVLQADVDVDGTPLLMRALTSNDGIWQDGADIYITGKWDDEPEPAGKEKTRPSR